MPTAATSLSVHDLVDHRLKLPSGELANSIALSNTVASMFGITPFDGVALAIGFAYDSATRWHDDARLVTRFGGFAEEGVALGGTELERGTGGGCRMPSKLIAHYASRAGETRTQDVVIFEIAWGSKVKQHAGPVDGAPAYFTDPIYLKSCISNS